MKAIDWSFGRILLFTSPANGITMESHKIASDFGVWGSTLLQSEPVRERVVRDSRQKQGRISVLHDVGQLWIGSGNQQLGGALPVAVWVPAAVGAAAAGWTPCGAAQAFGGHRSRE